MSAHVLLRKFTIINYKTPELGTNGKTSVEVVLDGAGTLL